MRRHVIRPLTVVVKPLDYRIPQSRIENVTSIRIDFMHDKLTIYLSDRSVRIFPLEGTAIVSIPEKMGAFALFGPFTESEPENKEVM